MSQKTTRASVTSEEKSRTDSPVREMKKKAAAEKERAEKDKEAKPDKPVANQNNAKSPQSGAEKNGKPAPSNEKKNEAEKSNESSEKKHSTPESPKPPETKQNVSKTPAKSSAEKATNGADKTINGTENATNGKEKPSNGSEKATNGTEKAGTEALNGTNSGRTEKPVEVIELDGEHEDEQFPELAYDDGSDEDPTPGARSVTRRSQVKAARTPETPRPVSNKTSAEDKSEDVPPTTEKESKLSKTRDEITGSPMKLRSADTDVDKPDESKTDDEEGKSKADESVTLKTDTNFSKSRIKVSPYRRSTRLQDSLIANYTGNNTTMEMDISEVSELASTSQPENSSHVSRRTIRGRRSYKTLGEFVPSPRRKDITIGADLRPTVHVVGRKRKTADDDEDTGSDLAYATEESVLPAAPVKRMRLLDRVVTPFSSLLRRRTVASSTPLPLRRSQPIVGINSDLPLHGDVQIAPEALSAPPSELGVLQTEPEVLKTPVEVAEIATEAHFVQTRQKCAIM